MWDEAHKRYALKVAEIETACANEIREATAAINKKWDVERKKANDEFWATSGVKKDAAHGFYNETEAQEVKI